MIYIADFFIVAPGRSKFAKLVDTAILSKIQEIDPNLTFYINELLETNKTEQQNITF